MAITKNSNNLIPTRLLTGDEIAEILNVSRSFAYQLMRTGEIPTVHIGRSVRVRQQDLELFIEENLSNAVRRG